MRYVNSSSATYVFAVIPLNVVTAKRHYRNHSITVKFSPSPRYYREIFPVPAVITVARGIAAFPITVSSSELWRCISVTYSGDSAADSTYRHAAPACRSAYLSAADRHR